METFEKSKQNTFVVFKNSYIYEKQIFEQNH